MFGKFMKKKSELYNDVQVDEAVETPSTKKWNSADMVLAGGLLAIMGGMFWMMSGSGEVEKKSTKPIKISNVLQESIKKPEQNTPFYEESKVITPKKDAPTQVEENPPFVYAQEADFSNENLMPPPEAYEQNNTLLAKKSLPVQKPSVPNKAPKVSDEKVEVMQESSTSRSLPKTIVQKPVAVATSSASYVCSIVDMYRDMLGKEIMYYIKDATSHKYVPAYAQENWDEAGVWVKEKFIASQVDVSERMAEVSAGKWIPALEFMTCTLVQEDSL